MPEAHVRPIESNLRAVHTSDADWREVLRGWFVAMEAPEDRIEPALADITQAVEAEKHKPWLVLRPEGVAFVHPADFVNHFEDVNATDVLDEIWQKRREHPASGYTAAHDDVHGLGHLLAEAVNRVSLMEGEDPQLRNEILTAASLLVAAVDLIDRGKSKQRELPTFYSQAAMERYEQQWMKQVSDYLVALDDLEGQAQDESKADTAPDEAVGWAREQFKQIFRVHDA